MKSRGEGRIFARKGSGFWWISYYHRGKEQREVAQHVRTRKKIQATEEGRREAEKFLRHRLGEITAERHGGPAFVGPQQQRIKVSELLDALEADYKLRGKDSPQFKSRLKHIRGYFGGWRAAEVTAEAVDRYIVERQDAATAPATINRHTQLLAQAFKMAIERKHLSSAPLIRHLSEKGNERQGFFADADFRAVKDKLPEYLRDFIQFGYLTGWRKGEIASLRWLDVDGDVIRLRGVNAKNGEGRSVTLSGDLAELMERRKAQRQVETKTGILLSAYVFHKKGERVGDFRKAWATACVAAGQGKFV
jgi:integrase